MPSPRTVIRWFLVTAALAGSGALQLGAQQAPPRDSIAVDVLIFSDVLMNREPAYVHLEARVPYRIEIIGEAAIFVRSVRPGASPTPLRAHSEPASAEPAITYLLIPHSTGEYLIQVSAGSPVRVRIYRDAREGRLLLGQARPPVGQLALGVRGGALLGEFEVSRGVGGLSGDNVESGAATGFELCLGAVRGRFRELPPKLGGCMLTLGRLSHGADARITTFGVAPDYLLARRGPFELAVELNVSFGKASYPFRRDVMYTVAGAGPAVIWNIAPRLTATAAPSLAIARRGGYEYMTSSGPRQREASTRFMPRLILATHVRL